MFFDDFEENQGRRQLEIEEEEDMQYRERKLEILNADTDEWGEA